MTPPVDHRLSQMLDSLLGIMRSNWLWPSPETGFARHVYLSAGEQVPVQTNDRAIWPDVQRLDEAPILAAAGYVLCDDSSLVRPDHHGAWANALRHLSGRNAFSPVHVSFAYRPLEVLGLSLGIVNCAAAERREVEWLRGIVARLRDEQISNDPWSDLIYGIAAVTVGENWKNRLFFDLNDTGAEVLAVLRWLLETQPSAAHGKLSERDQIDAELLRRFRSNHLPRDVARAAVLHRALAHVNVQRQEPSTPAVTQEGVRRHIIQLDVSPRSFQNMPSGMNMNFTLVNGDPHMGDSININGNVSGSAVGTGAIAVVGDINAFQNMVDNSTRLQPDLKARLKEAREAVEQLSLGDADRKDILDDLGKLTDEMEKQSPEPGRVGRFFNRIKEIAPTAASILSSVASIAKLVQLAHGHG